MADREGRNPGEEDLFEDLDKFFAPIQDVDWPESTDPGARQGPPERREPERSEPERSEPGPADEPVGADTEAFEAPIRIGEAEEEPAGPTPGQEDLFAEGEAGAGEETAPAGAEPSDGDGVTSFLFESEAEEELEPEEALGEGSLGAQGAYVDLPGAGEDEGVAELIEERAADEPAPDLDAVEAAADRFAESVREETGDAESVSRSTEEVQIAALLGDEDMPEIAEPETSRTVRVGQEGLGGPSWQEPTALEVGAESERRGPGRDVPMAFLTGLILAGLAIGAIAIGTGPFAVFAGVVVLFAQGEFYQALQKAHHQPATALGLVAGALVLWAGYFSGEEAMLAMLALSTFATFLWYLAVPAQHRRDVVSNVALTVLGIAYIPGLAAFALPVLRLEDGRSLTVAIIGLAIVYDIAAFGVGYFWGSRPLAPNVSPKKSWEGAIGATLVVVAVAVGGVAPSVDLLETVGRSVGLAVVIAIFAPLGDLAESLLKRDLGLKDMGAVLPGHGGVLDRIDSVLFVAPAALMFLRVVLT